MTALEQFGLAKQVAIVTGAAQGLGRAMARALAEAGATVVIADRNGDLGDETAAALRLDGLEACAMQLDVAQPDQVEAVFKSVHDDFGHVDVLVNNAGIVFNTPSAELSFEEWQKVLDVNLTGVFLCSQSAGRFMIRQGKGSIVSIASMVGIIVNRPPLQLSYNASKGGVIMLTKGLAAEWAQHGVRVNAIAPGYMRTPLMEQALREMPESAEMRLSATPMGRVGRPEELGGAVVFLASEASSFMTGQTLVIDGGFTLW